MEIRSYRKLKDMDMEKDHGWGEYNIRYSNGDYWLLLIYKTDESGKPIFDVDPTDSNQLFVQTVSLKPGLPEIIVNVVKVGDVDSEYVLFGELTGRIADINELNMETETDEMWIRAYENFMRMDKIVRKEFPGYCLYNKR